MVGSDCPGTLCTAPPGELVFRVRGPSRRGQLVRLRSAKCTIGSSPQCTLRLRARGVQPVHCLILRGKSATLVRRWAADTRLNGRGFADQKLKPGDLLSIGPVDLEVVALGFPPGEGLGEPGEVRADKQSEAIAERARQLAARERSLAEKARQLEVERAELAAEAQRLEQLRGQLAARQEQVEAQQRRFEEERRQFEAERRTSSAEPHQAQPPDGGSADSLPQRIEELEQARQELEERRRQWELEQQVRAKELDQRSAELQTRCRELDQREQRLKEFEERRTQLAEQQRADQSSAELERLRARLEELESQLAEKQREIDAQRSQLDARRQELDRREQELAQRAQRLDRRHAELDRSRQQLDQREQVIEQRAERLEASRRQLEQREAQLNDQLHAIEQRSAELDRCQRELDQLAEQLEDQRRRLEIGPSTMGTREAQPAGTGDRESQAGPDPRVADATHSLQTVPDAASPEAGGLQHAENELAFQEPEQRAPVELTAVLRKMGVGSLLPEDEEDKAPSDPAQMQQTTGSASLPKHRPAAEESARPDTLPSETAGTMSQGAQGLLVSPTSGEASAAKAEPQQPATQSDAGRTEESDSDSIDEYMARLLERVRSASAGKGQAHGQPSAPGAGESSSAEPASRVAPSGWRRMRKRPERGAAKPPENVGGLSAMRELAAQAARAAIDTHARRQTIRARRTKALVALTGLVVGGALLWMWQQAMATDAAYYGGLVSLLVTVVWGIQYAVLSGRLIVNRFGSLELKKPAGGQKTAPGRGAKPPAAWEKPGRAPANPSGECEKDAGIGQPGQP